MCIRDRADRGHGGDAQTLVDLGTAGVVDAGGHVLHTEHLAGHARGDDVGVVAAGDGGEGAGLLDARLAQGVLVEADAGDPAAPESRAQPAEGGGVLVDHGDRVSLLLQGLGKSGTHSSAAHDDDVHDRPSGVQKLLLSIRVSDRRPKLHTGATRRAPLCSGWRREPSASDAAHAAQGQDSEAAEGEQRPDQLRGRGHGTSEVR